MKRWLWRRIRELNGCFADEAISVDQSEYRECAYFGVDLIDHGMALVDSYFATHSVKPIVGSYKYKVLRQCLENIVQ